MLGPNRVPSQYQGKAAGLDAKRPYPTSDQLQSEAIEAKVGELHAEVLRHDDTRAEHPPEEIPLREAIMCTSDGEPQYYALTFLTYDPQDDKIYAIDSEIRDGGMIGKTFAKHGYTIRKNVIDVFTVKLTPELKAKLQVTDEYGKGRLTEFYIRHDDSSPSIYSHILEIKPHHLEAADVDGFDVAQLNPASDVLARHNISTDDVWDHLPDAASTDEWVDRDSEYTAAQHESLPEIMGWRTRIEKQLHVTLYSAGEHQRPLS